MLCLPVFIILLLLASSAAPNPLDTNLQSDLIRAALGDADQKGQKGLLYRHCCPVVWECCQK
nr:TPA_inf: conotoxin precursor T [Conus ebraeus]